MKSETGTVIRSVVVSDSLPLEKHLDNFSARIDKRSDEKFGRGKWAMVVRGLANGKPGIEVLTFILGADGQPSGRVLSFEMVAIDDE